MRIERISIDVQDFDPIFNNLETKILKAMERHGTGTFASQWEILGGLTEEYHEVREAIHSKNLESVENELYDVAVVALVGLITLDYQKRRNS